MQAVALGRTRPTRRCMGGVADVGPSRRGLTSWLSRRGGPAGRGRPRPGWLRRAPSRRPPQPLRQSPPARPRCPTRRTYRSALVTTSWCLGAAAPLSVPYRGKQWIACHECRAETSVQPGPRRPTCRHRAQAAGRLRRSWTATMTTSRTGLSNHEQRTNGPSVEEAVHLAEIAFHKARRRARESVGVRFGCHTDRPALRACRLASG